MPRLSYSSLVKGSPDVLQLLVSFTDDTPVIIVIIIIIIVLGQLHPITVYRTGLWVNVFCCWVSLGAHFIISFIEFYFIMIFIMIVW